MMRKVILAIVVLAAASCVWLVLRNRAHEVTVRTYFHNAHGLQRHSKVRANGLEVGTVKDVSLSPRAGDQPVEVVLRLDSRDSARIPNDSTATIETEGLLGPPYVEIDVSKATGTPVGSNAVLRGVDTGGSAAILQRFADALDAQAKKMTQQTEKLRQTIDSANSQKKK